MSIVISTSGSMLNLTFSDGRIMGIESTTIQRIDLINDDIFIYQIIIENNKRIYPHNPDVIKLDYNTVIPSYDSAALLYTYLNDLIGLLSAGGGGVSANVNLASVAGTTADVNSGISTDGTQRITIATDDTQFGEIGDPSELAGNVHSQLRYIGENIGGGMPTAEYMSPSDLTATFTSSTTITLSSLPFTIVNSTQLAYIKYVSAAGLSDVLVNGQSGVSITVSSNVVSVIGAGTPFASGDSYEVGINSQTKAYDASTNTQMNSVINPIWSRYTDSELLVTAQDLTAVYADFGSEIDMTGYTHLRVAIVADVNTSDNVTLKVLGKDESAGTNEYELEGGTTQELWTTGASDMKMSYTFDVKGTPIVQLQAIAGTLGTAGDLTITITKIWRG
jgi:hypothetical protein